MSFLDRMKSLASETRAKQQLAQDEWRQRRLDLINTQFERIIESLQSDIKKDACGEGSLKGHVMGFVHYWLEDESHTQLKLENSGTVLVYLTSRLLVVLPSSRPIVSPSV